MQFFKSFYGGQLKQLYTANFYMVCNPFKMAVQFKFSQFYGPNAFSPKFQQAPVPNFRKVAKSLR